VETCGIGYVCSWNFRRKKGAPSRQLRADDDFVGGGGELKFYAAGLVCVDGVGEVEGGECYFFVPGSVGVVVAGGVENAVGDGIVGNFFAPAVAEYEDSGGSCCGEGEGVAMMECFPGRGETSA
jgi:hypothetical protein